MSKFDAFEWAVSITLDLEGNAELSRDSKDPGNWTSGKIGKGKLVGTKYGISAACLHPDTRVLTRDMRWVRNGDVEEGDELIGFVRDDEKRGLRLEPTTVLRTGPLELPSVEIVTNKRTLVASREHLWWATRPSGTARSYQWVMSGDLQPGYEIAQWRQPWNDDLASDPGAQWLAGIIDGEAHLADGGTLSIYQNEGAVAQRIRRELERLGLSWYEELRRREDGRENIKFVIRGDAFELIGRLRPVRLLEAAERTWHGRCTHGRYNEVERVTEVRDVGLQPVVGMITSTGTFIAEGLMSHNSYPGLDIASLTLVQAKAVYRQDYWEAMGCPSMTRHLAALVFDSAVQHGVARAKEWLVQPVEFEAYLSQRLRAYGQDPNLASFAAGWFNRLATLLADIAKMPDSVNTIVLDGGVTFWQRLSFVLRKRMDGGFLWRERTLASGSGGKIDFRGGT